MYIACFNQINPVLLFLYHHIPQLSNSLQWITLYCLHTHFNIIHYHLLFLSCLPTDVSCPLRQTHKYNHVLSLFLSLYIYDTYTSWDHICIYAYIYLTGLAIHVFFMILTSQNSHKALTILLLETLFLILTNCSKLKLLLNVSFFKYLKFYLDVEWLQMLLAFSTWMCLTQDTFGTLAIVYNLCGYSGSS
jgi:hypothetical protein